MAGNDEEFFLRHSFVRFFGEGQGRTPDRLRIQGAGFAKLIMVEHADERVRQLHSHGHENNAAESERNKLDQALRRVMVADGGANVRNQLRFRRVRMGKKNLCGRGYFRLHKSECGLIFWRSLLLRGKPERKESRIFGQIFIRLRS